MPAITKSGKFLTKTKTQADIGGLPSIRLYEKQLGSQGATSYTVFTLSGAYVPNSNTLNVFVNGHRAEKVLSGATNATQYIETNAKTITFGASLQTTDVVEFVIFGSYPVSNYEYNTNTYEYTTVTSGTQVVLPFTPNVLISVYIDGVRQQSDGFTISGTTVTFAESLPGGTRLLFVSPNTDDTPIINTDTLDGYHLSELFGKLPNCDDNSVGPDLTGFNGFARILNNSVNAGVTFSKTIVSTYSLIVSGGYIGGVLAPNGDIHFVPFTATVGQKVSASGVVSTYSLVYTTSVAYVGGVLAPNGDIHFVPFTATVGQKVSASGVVSTYSLVYTAVNAYFGGVLAPNGDIHFIPFNAPVGQKVSAAGVVSTYSLAYTTAGAYIGGVLAPNGDIHFVPYSAAVGQKVSLAGVVSTYALVYTKVNAYIGGVLSPNGDIHFIPRNASVGQKINSAGIVSTYSLAYTTINAYNGGILAPNGDIYFISYYAPVGQKVSASGVVSTYSLAYTTADAYVGGVLSPNGDIHFVPYSAAVGQKISTMSALPLSLAVCCSPFLNKL
jgi:hypothetical protein